MPSMESVNSRAKMMRWKRRDYDSYTLSGRNQVRTLVGKVVFRIKFS